jgi:hypothetical protein
MQSETPFPMSAERNDVLDQLAIQSVKANYCRAADLLPVNADAASAGLEKVFAVDATADYGHGLLQNRAAILNFLVEQLSTTRVWLWHAIHTPLIEISGDEASAWWTIVAMMRETSDGLIETAYGRYEDFFKRTEDGWKIASMRWVEEART